MILNDLNKIKKLDKGDAKESIKLLPDQVKHVLQDSRLINIPKDYSKINQVIVHGMGGSNIGARIIKSVFSDQIKFPINISAGYKVPAYVDKNTLYILSSYSGTTEEVLSVYKEVKKRGAKILAITAHGNGKLEKLMIKDKIYGYIFNPEFNPAGQPRLALGYSVFGIASMLSNAGLFKINESEIKNIVSNLEKFNKKLIPEVNAKNNLAKNIAVKLQDKQIVLVGAEFLEGNIKTLRNQICETSKNFTSYLTLPDLNHFAMESLGNPKSNINNLVFFFIDSDLYHPRIKKRSILTKEVVNKNKIKIVDHKLFGKTKLAQSFELLQLGTWISYYLGMLNGVDPVSIPWVDWFKKELK
ncbi:MAG: SIS domain-containing protein [Candidatus Falkowbacteria bacterium]